MSSIDASPITKSGSLPIATGATTLGTLVLRATARYDGTALRHYVDGAWRDVSYPELGRIAREIAGGLIALGVQPGDRVGVLASTCAQWTMVDCGVLCAGATVVPVYATNSPAECLHVLGHSDASIVFCEDAAQRDKVLAIRDELPSLRQVITFDDSGELSLAQLRARAAEAAPDAVDRAAAAVDGHDIATIVYTSGTSGPAKGCLTTHTNCIATISMYEAQIDLTSARPVVLFLFLPLAHTLARMAQLVALDVGGTLAYWRGDPALVLEDLAEARPTHLPAVPRVFEKVHTRATGAAQDAGRLRGTALGWALAIGRRRRSAQRAGRAPGPLPRLTQAIADRLVLSRVRDLFGGRLELALTGAAPISAEVVAFFDACGVTILEGYGLTESCAAATLNTVDQLRFGSVGRALPGTEIAIAADEEILLRGPQIFAGYHRDPDQTQTAMTPEGWLRTGDLGRVDDDGFLHVTGRKKDLIITSSGKNIAPSNLEAALAEGRWISQAVVFGDERPYLVALLTLDGDEAPALAARCGIPCDLEAMASHPAVRAHVQEEVDAVNAEVARIEQIKRFEILDHELDQAAGELTPTMKIKRNVVYQRYADRFAALYEDAEG